MHAVKKGDETDGIKRNKNNGMLKLSNERKNKTMPALQIGSPQKG